MTEFAEGYQCISLTQPPIVPNADAICASVLAQPVTAAQNEKSCIMFGMPQEAIALVGVDAVPPLSSISASVLATRMAL